MRASRKTEDVIVVGGGHAGLTAAYCLRRRGIDPLVLERARVAESWRQRWDSFTLVTPNWTVRLPGQEVPVGEPDAFLRRDEVVSFLERCQQQLGARLECGVEVQSLTRTGNDTFRLKTVDGECFARSVIVAAGPYQQPSLPGTAKNIPDNVFHVHTAGYRHPKQLPEGRVLVVGSAQSGTQIAEELLRSGRDVFLSLGRVGRVPRRYRGRDGMTWMRELGLLDKTVDSWPDKTPPPNANPHITGKEGGRTIYLRELATRGITLVGRLQGIEGGKLVFSPDVSDRVDFADQVADTLIQRIDAFIAEQKIDAPAAEPEPARNPVRAGPGTVDATSFSAIVWATGFRVHFPWIHLPVFDELGRPRHVRGVTSIPGLYFLGLVWQWKAKSSLIYGSPEDAEYLADHIARDLGIGA
jgi:putative flavoprotein involved in K+ transport